MPKVAVIMGSDSDLPVLEGALKRLKKYGIELTARVLSAHRTPEEAAQLAKNARDEGIEVIIAAASKAAHLPGVLAAFTTLPVIGLPVKSSFMDGLDSLLSIAMMPSGVPVATVGVDAADNAAILALEILGIKYPQIAAALREDKAKMAAEVAKKDAALQREIDKL